MNRFEQRFVFIKPSRSARAEHAAPNRRSEELLAHADEESVGGNSRSYLKVRQTPVAWGTVTVYLPS